MSSCMAGFIREMQPTCICVREMSICITRMACRIKTVKMECFRSGCRVWRLVAVWYEMMKLGDMIVKGEEFGKVKYGLLQLCIQMERMGVETFLDFFFLMS